MADESGETITLRPDAAEIVFDHVTKRYGGSDRPAVDDLTLTIPAGEICVLIGPSGGGKTTAMKLVNRLISLTEGDITIDGTSVMRMDPVELRRGIGYVIQQIGLFPHMTIEANVATVPKLVGWDRGRTRARARELLELLGLDPDEYAGRYPAQLSGGQRLGDGRDEALQCADALIAEPPFPGAGPGRSSRPRPGRPLTRSGGRIGVASLVIGGGPIGAVGIRNPRRGVEAKQCSGGRLAGAPLDAAGVHGPAPA
jgi:ABC-type lipoprotein export system ATPase subunit